ncbi:MAG: GNAT family N-acetyltransferase [Acidimicrobiia bacterium]
METIDYDALRRAIQRGSARLEVMPLVPGDVERVSWSGSKAHLESIARQLPRVDAGEVEYLVVHADGHPVCKGGIDFAEEPGAGTVWQIATHPQVEGAGLATLLIGELEVRAMQRGVRRLRLGVELDNPRARRLYEHLGYAPIGESEASWEAEAKDGSRFVYATRLTEMLKVV